MLLPQVLTFCLLSSGPRELPELFAHYCCLHSPRVIILCTAYHRAQNLLLRNLRSCKGPLPAAHICARHSPRRRTAVARTKPVNALYSPRARYDRNIGQELLYAQYPELLLCLFVFNCVTRQHSGNATSPTAIARTLPYRTFPPCLQDLCPHLAISGGASSWHCW